MSLDYDLVVIGNTPAAFFAASFASQLRARVALVKQLADNTISDYSLLYGEINFSPTNFEEFVSGIREQELSCLSSLGVDVVEGEGEFCRLPRLGFIVGARKLFARTFLLATGSHFMTPNMIGLESINYVTPLSLWQQNDLTSLPQNLIVIGDGILALEWANKLIKLEKNVTLVISESQLLPQEDQDVSRWLQAYLEAQGITILTNSPVTQVKMLEQQKWIQAGDKAIAADEIIIATEERMPHIEGLNLTGIGVELGNSGVKVNQYLQTSHPRIYACGDMIEGYGFAHVAQYEAKIAVKNALFLPLFKVDYTNIPYCFFADVQLARVGLTESQAIERYGKNITIAKEYFKNVALAQVLGQPTGFCKLIIEDNGRILGAHIFGVQAGELITAIALAMGQKLKINTLANLSLPQWTLSEIITKTARQWEKDHLARQTILLNCLETLFLWLRSWFRYK